MKNKWSKTLWVASAASVTVLLNACGGTAKTTGSDNNYTQYVNPYIGSEGHGHVFVGANVPYGAVQLGPVNIMQTWDKFNGWDWCSGYNYISKEILGFAHTHLSGTGISDLNDILVLPANGTPALTPMKFENEASGYGSNFTKENEKVAPGYYSVYLDKYKIQAQLTATERAGFHEYKFDKTDSAHILVDLAYAMGWDKPMETAFNVVNDSTILGYRFSKGWAPDQRVFFAIKLAQPATNIQLFDSTAALTGKNVTGRQLKALLFVDAVKQPTIKMKVGISPTSSEKALANLDTEISHWNFDQVKQDADKKWNDQLGTIQFDADKETSTIFYTSLYHTMFVPSLFNDHDRGYMGTDKKKYPDPGFDNYTLFSLWDTYRGLHPLMTLVQPQRVNDIIRSFLKIYQQQGKLPVWHLNGNETNTMVGYPAIPVIVDAYLKGFRDYDVNLAYEAIKQSAMQQTDGIQFIQKLQYIPADSVRESVAKAQEYALSDWAIAAMAKDLGKQEDADYFSKRAKLYELYFDKSTGHFRGRMGNDTWRTPFNPLEAKHRDNDYCEGNAWQYTWLVPQDVHGLKQLFGGDQGFLQKLDTFFTTHAQLGAEASPDISGMIGQYAHGNEPNHHIPYLYAYGGQPWKTADIVRQVADTFYTTKPDGLCGNEDAGQMSAWYVLSAMGFYPVNPAQGIFIFGSPLMNKAVLQVGNKKTFNIDVVNQAKENKYIQSIKLNGKDYTKSYIDFKDIAAGGNLQITMGSKPSDSFGVKQEDRP